MQFPEEPTCVDNYWTETDIQHVWYNSLSCEYMFSDEAEQFNGPFPTKEQAELALTHYIINYL